MKLVNTNGKTLDEKEQRTAIKMLKDALQAQLDYYRNEIAESNNLGLELEEKARALEVFNIQQVKLDQYENHISEVSGDRKRSLEELFEAERYLMNYQILLAFNRAEDKRLLRNMAEIFRMNGDWNLVQNGAAQEIPVKDSKQGYENSAQGFTLAVEPMEGIEEIISFIPDELRNPISYLDDARSGNSGTIKENNDRVTELIEEIGNESDEDNNEKELIDIIEQRAMFTKVNTLSESLARSLREKKTTSFADIYDIFSRINENVNLGQTAGKLRGEAIFVRTDKDTLNGTSPNALCSQMLRLMNDISDKINTIKATKNEALQKTQAVQLAAYTYQMALSIHPFSDANGRSCRLLADTILQSFGLPPHIPEAAEKEISCTMGNPMDFRRGAEIFLDGVKNSSARIKDYNKKLIDEYCEFSQRMNVNENNARITEAVQNIQDPGQEAFRREVEAMEREKYNGCRMIRSMSDEKAENYSKIAELAESCRGTFRDSREYTEFNNVARFCADMAGILNDAKKGSDLCIDINKIDRKTGIIIKQMPKYAGSNTMTLVEAGQILYNARKGMVEKARAYVEYKLKDHTFDTKAERNKKAMNTDDRLKLKLMQKILPQNDPLQQLLDPLSAAPANQAVREGEQQVERVIERNPRNL